MTDNFDAIKDFLTPKEILVEEIDVNHSKIILEPLERGFGHTLGNALRRIILSSTPGAAVVEAKIDGVLHDYSTIDGIKEDVINILLNLKGMSVKLLDQEEAEMTVEKSGAGDLTAGDFDLPAGVEVVNPDHKIAKKILPLGSGSIIVFGIKGGRDAGKAFIENVKLSSHLANVGDSKTLLIHPGSTTHSHLSSEAMKMSGLTDDLIRLSVGLEDIEDIKIDFEKGFKAAAKISSKRI